jgi:UDP-N-acetylglucosamine 2-epimerase (non-hydrolysing)
MALRSNKRHHNPDPLPYTFMMSLLIGSKKVITDSGGPQKEAYFAGVPALVMMPDTGWIELVEPEECPC